jgi:hypothetical protein
VHFRSTRVFSVKKADNSANIASGGIINLRTRNSLCRDKKKHQVTSYVMIYKIMSRVTPPGMRELSCASTLFA